MGQINEHSDSDSDYSDVLQVGNSRPLHMPWYIIYDDGYRRELLSRAAQTMAAFARLKTNWKDKILVFPIGF